jgi:hypothetical protein
MWIMLQGGIIGMVSIGFMLLMLKDNSLRISWSFYKKFSDGGHDKVLK